MVTSKPSKQRKMFFNAPAHRRRRMLAARLSDDLTKNHKVRRLPVRTGDSVRVMRGDFAGKSCRRSLPVAHPCYEGADNQPQSFRQVAQRTISGARKTPRGIRHGEKVRSQTAKAGTLTWLLANPPEGTHLGTEDTPGAPRA